MKWNISPKEAIAVQNKLRSKVILRDDFSTVKTIAGADIALSKSDKTGLAGVIVYKYPELVEIERVWCKGEIGFPYIPGLLSFREAPLLLKAFAKLRTRPDLAIFDGQGIAHPRRFGIASHMGLLLGIPTIGCAKSRLTGKYREPGGRAGCFSYLYDCGYSSIKPEIIGAVVRTRDKVRPIFISPGHKISLKTAIKIILNCVHKYRIPKPTREADIYVGALKIF